MGKGKLKKVFPGGNTCSGFYSYYDYIIEPDATRILVIKGGPGVGKSTLMRWIGEQMLERGYDVEFHCCSSDNNSLDGIMIPTIKVAMLDGTAPHIVDPKNPGVVDEIIHLGDYWNEPKLRESKKEVLASNARVGRLFKTAYSQLAEAKIIKDELDSYYDEAINYAQVNGIIHEIAKSIISKAEIQFDRKPKDRHLFATAFTPKGQDHHLDTILQDVEKLYFITGAASAAGSYIVETVADAIHMHGLDTEVYHCAMEPEKVDLVVIPAMNTAVLKDVPGINFKPQEVTNIKKIKMFNLDKFINQNILAVYAKEIKCCSERLHSAICRALGCIAAAKEEHDAMEKYYIPAMDFDAINAKRDEILQRILKYAEEFK
ncbi:hypothetical protein JOC37_001826 [Desulfohalotomaculum tongense]|uniref:PRK06851 family protein n=1 Tax=Desulforadius tongensis TaxID=1216062 RepID=UPI00195EE546|nr:hypothetical protein [Desulforadius tongensis]